MCTNEELTKLVESLDNTVEQLYSLDDRYDYCIANRISIVWNSGLCGEYIGVRLQLSRKPSVWLDTLYKMYIFEPQEEFKNGLAITADPDKCERIKNALKKDYMYN